MNKPQQVLFLGKGRLGNQVFQWTALRKAFPTSMLWAPSLASLPSVFQTEDWLRVTLPHPLLDRLLRRKLGRLMMRGLFKHLRIGGYGWEPTPLLENGADAPTGRLMLHRIERKLVFVDGGYYQNFETTLEPGDFRTLKLQPALVEQAREQVRAAIGSAPWPRIVLHVRRTDYLQFKPYGLQDVTLPAAYYERAAMELRRRFGNDTPVLVVTDDAAWCREELAGVEPFNVMSTSETIDFAVLSMFPGIAVSNSTFSLAAACVGRTVELVVAPEFWFGARIRQWYPAHLRTDDPRFLFI